MSNLIAEGAFAGTAMGGIIGSMASRYQRSRHEKESLKLRREELEHSKEKFAYQQEQDKINNAREDRKTEIQERVGTAQAEKISAEADLTKEKAKSEKKERTYQEKMRKLILSGELGKQRSQDKYEELQNNNIEQNQTVSSLKDAIKSGDPSKLMSDGLPAVISGDYYDDEGEPTELNKEG